MDTCFVITTALGMLVACERGCHSG